VPYASLEVNPKQNKQAMKIKSKGHPRKVILDGISLGLTYSYIKKIDLKKIAETGFIELPKKRKHKKKVKLYG